jgi:hypothetical protein
MNIAVRTAKGVAARAVMTRNGQTAGTHRVSFAKHRVLPSFILLGEL